MKITKDMEIRSLNYPDDAGKHSAGDGLVLLINKSGKYWQYPYTFGGKRKQASLGVYAPGKTKHVSLKAAKSARQDARDLLDSGIDPNEQAKQRRFENKQRTDRQKAERKAARQKKRDDKNTFEAVARKWHAVQSSGWVESHSTWVISTLNNHAFPAIGSVPVADLGKNQVAGVIDALIDAGKIPTAKKLTQVIRAILDHAYDADLITAVPMGNMRSHFPAYKAKAMPAITKPAEVGKLLRSMAGYTGAAITCAALRLLPYVFLRSGEFRHAKWQDIDFQAAVWLIPATNRKQRLADKQVPANTHTVPLSKQAVALLKDLHLITGGSSEGYLFPNRDGVGVMSENTINKALKKMGYGGEQVGHGFRAIFSTAMNDRGFNPDAIESQLSHAGKNAVRAAYLRSDFMEERTKMMQAWADYLDALRDGADVIPIKRRA